MGPRLYSHLEIDADPAVVTMYDRDGKKVLEARIGPPDTAKVSLVSCGSYAGRRGILAVGARVMTDGSIQRFIAKTDLHRAAYCAIATHGPILTASGLRGD